MTEQLVISLGSSCDSGNQLKRIAVNHVHYYLTFTNCSTLLNKSLFVITTLL